MTKAHETLDELFQPALQARDSLWNQTRHRPEIAVVLGSGIQIFEDLKDPEVVPFTHIAGFPQATVKGHKGEITLGEYEGKSLAIFRGRFHRYEGHPWHNIVFQVNLMHQMGIKTLVLTNSAGGIHRYYTPGDLVLVRDHINWQFMTEEERHFLFLQSQSNRITGTYSEALSQQVREAARIAEVDLRQGIYACLTGPTYETHAELIMLSRMGADLVGMSTVPEAVWASSLGMQVAVLSCVTNVTYDPRALAHTSHEEVVTVAKQSSLKLEKLLQELLRRV